MKSQYKIILLILFATFLTSCAGMKRIFSKEKTEANISETTETTASETSTIIDNSVIIVETSENADTLVMIDGPVFTTEVESNDIDSGKEVIKKVDGGTIIIKKDPSTGKITTSFKGDNKKIPIKINKTTRRTEKKDVTTAGKRDEKSESTSTSEIITETKKKDKKREDVTTGIAWSIWGVVIGIILLLVAAFFLLKKFRIF